MTGASEHERLRADHAPVAVEILLEETTRRRLECARLEIKYDRADGVVRQKMSNKDKTLF